MKVEEILVLGLGVGLVGVAVAVALRKVEVPLEERNAGLLAGATQETIDKVETDPEVIQPPVQYQPTPVTVSIPEPKPVAPVVKPIPSPKYGLTLSISKRKLAICYVYDVSGMLTDLQTGKGLANADIGLYYSSDGVAWASYPVYLRTWGDAPWYGKVAGQYANTMNEFVWMRGKRWRTQYMDAVSSEVTT